MNGEVKPQLPAGMKMDLIVVFRSPDGEKDWQIIAPAEVPEFVKDPDTMGRLMAGDIVRNVDVSQWWYRAEKMLSEKEVRRVFGNAKRHAKIEARKLRRRAH